MEWEAYWKNLLDNKKLWKYIDEMNQVDRISGNPLCIEEICHEIYDDYKNVWRCKLENVKVQFHKLIEEFQGVHLQSSRIKTVDSLLVKVITKRYDNLRNIQSPYRMIKGNNYKDIITDLIGMRLIINYRGKWQVIHKDITTAFPYADPHLYETGKLLPHSQEGDNLLAEVPIVYYAQGDQVDSYKRMGLETKLHNKGYRSIHYIVSFCRIYIEIQVRTIYDEAWSDCDHSYVYKQDENKSHSALERLSQILCNLTNISNDMGENMREIFEKESIEDMHNGCWSADLQVIDAFDRSMARIEKAYQELEGFRTCLISKQGV